MTAREVRGQVGQGHRGETFQQQGLGGVEGVVLLHQAGFEAIELFNAAFTFKGRVARTPSAPTADVD